MYLIEPEGRKRKYDIRLRNHDGRIVRIPGDRNADVARRVGDRIEMLVRAKANGDAPPAELKVWIDNMPDSLSRRLVGLGLLEQYRFERLKPLTDHIDQFEKIVAARKSNTEKHAARQASNVRRLVAKVGATSLSDLTEDRVLTALMKMETRRVFNRQEILDRSVPRSASRVCGGLQP